MKSLFTVVIFTLFFCSVNAQNGKALNESPGEYFNKFQDFTNQTPNADSAFYYLKKLASNKMYSSFLQSLIHDSFAQVFSTSYPTDEMDSLRLHEFTKRRLLGKEILAKVMADTTRELIEEVKPLYVLTQVQDEKNNPESLKNLTNEFIKTELGNGDVYLHRAGRYGLMIYKVISEKSALKTQSAQLFSSIMLSLKDNQINYSESLSGPEFNKRAWYRYQYAYVNFLESGKTDDVQKKELLLKTAFEFSPDLIDKSHKSAYFYDMYLLTGGENESYGDEYLEFLTKNVNDKKQALTTLLQMALVDPTYKDQLKTYYNAHVPDKNFNDYWQEEILRTAKVAPPISLNILGGNPFSSKDHSGKWILVDFWGTWCGPCRQEHPDLQKFYESTILENKNNISLLTIACRDQEDKVLTYMSTKKFSFPVAMADNQIEKTYAIPGYPAKILIAPNGKYVTIPFGVDWVNFVSKYSGLN